MTDPTEMSKHILVSGAGGFLGRVVTARARLAGHRVTEMRRADGDCRRGKDVARFVEQVRPDVIIDACGVIPGTGDVFDNVGMTKNWIEAAAHLESAPVLVLVGSAAVFGSGAPSDRGTREDDPMEPFSDYGESKVEALELAQFAAARGKVDVRTGLLFNLMGAGQPDHLAPQVFVKRALAAGHGAYHVGPVGAVRDFMDIRDAADALLALALVSDPTYRLVNIATGEPRQIRDVLETLKARTGANWVTDGNDNDPRGNYVCYGDPTRLKAMTGWAPKFSFDDALDQVIAAARRAQSGQNTRTAS